ncbi:MAG TPA: RNA polymerase sigma factor [Gammaproteobacteria bacterium]|nr:RNA polymerase sigma factor [Gammaproteobacteria bacterium]
MEQPVSDEDLMLRYRQGDAAAFADLYERHKGGLYRYILRKCINHAHADELFQDVWVKLIAAKDRYEVRARFTTWLYRMAHNHCVDYYRRQSTTIGNLQAGAIAADELAARQSDQPEDGVERQQQADRLLQLLDGLPDEQREAFVLHEEAGMGVAEIAEVTGVNPETAKSRLRYAVRKLRQGLQSDG